MSGKKITHLIRETKDYSKVIEEMNEILIKYGIMEIEAFGLLEALKLDIYNSVYDQEEEDA